MWEKNAVEFSRSFGRKGGELRQQMFLKFVFKHLQSSFFPSMLRIHVTKLRISCDVIQTAVFNKLSF
jgi:hypothetical protein